jgi:hypothetical protein
MTENKKQDEFEKHFPKSARIIKETPHAIKITIGKTKGIILGSGASARATNIQTIMQLLKNGHSENEIFDYLELYFKHNTILEYIRVARKHNSEGKGGE